MIGSHDTFTYMKPTIRLFELFSRLWRTQKRSISEQYAFGVRFFDLRVCWHKGKWCFAHGLATFDFGFPQIADICSYMNEFFPLAVYRIVLERGNRKVEKRFIGDVLDIPRLSRYGNLWLVDIKKNRIWRGQILNRSELLAAKGFKFCRNASVFNSPNEEKHGMVNMENFWKADLKADAKRINERMNDLTTQQRMLDSMDKLYLIDYATNEY